MASVHVMLMGLIVNYLQLVAATSPYSGILGQFDVEPFSNITDTELQDFHPDDCREVQICGSENSGVYRIFPFRVGKGFLVYCDMVTDGGGWLVFQRRQDGTVDFNQNWQTYKDGFGNFFGEFWLGLDKIHILSNIRQTELMVNLGHFNSATGWAKYGRFRVADERGKYRLLAESFTGNIAMMSEARRCLLPSNCREVQTCGSENSGVYRIFPFRVGKGFLVYCDMVTDGDGWLVFQRRQDGTIDFYRNWQNYKDGFGNLFGEFWLGLDKIHILSNIRQTQLMVNFGHFDGATGWAKYGRFRVADERGKYRLLVESYKGNIGDAMTNRHNGMAFSTHDQDSDVSEKENCASKYRGAWWYGACHHSNLNAEYLQIAKKSVFNEYAVVSWYQWRNTYEPLQFLEMKMRPVGVS